MLELEGAIITIDIMGCQTVIAEKIVDAGVDYVLAVKENQKFLYYDMINAFAQTPKAISETTLKKRAWQDKKRTRKIITDMVWTNKKEDWKNLQTIISIETERTTMQINQIQTEQRFYIASLLTTPIHLN